MTDSDIDWQDWDEMSTLDAVREVIRLADEAARGLTVIHGRLKQMTNDPSITAEGFARVIEESAQVMECDGIHSDLATDLRAQGLALVSQLRFDGRDRST